MRLDVKKTADARARHNAGVRRLRALLVSGWRGQLMAEFVRGTDQSGRGRPVRTRPGTPPIRDAYHQAKHKRRKAAKAARRRNRKG